MRTVRLTIIIGMAAAVGCSSRPVSRTTALSQEPARPMPLAEPVGALVAEDGRPEAKATTDLDRYRALLNDPDEGVRIAAARVLMERGNIEGQTVLLQALQNPDPHHRIDAVLALKRVADPEVGAALKQAAKIERHPVARLVFKKALKRLGP